MAKAQWMNEESKVELGKETVRMVLANRKMDSRTLYIRNSTRMNVWMKGTHTSTSHCL
jgi:hypothetical protein